MVERVGFWRRGFQGVIGDVFGWCRAGCYGWWGKSKYVFGDNMGRDLIRMEVWMARRSRIVEDSRNKFWRILDRGYTTSMRHAMDDATVLDNDRGRRRYGDRAVRLVGRDGEVGEGPI